MPSPRRKRSRSRSKDDFKYPASSSKELKALLLQFMHTDKFTVPIDSLSLMKNLRLQFKSSSGKMMMKNFNITDLLQELEDKKAIKLQKLSLGSNKAFWIIVSVAKEIVLNLCRETSKDRPKKLPAAVSDGLEKFPWTNPVKSVSFEGIRSNKPEQTDNFRVTGTVKDLKTADLVLINMKEFKYFAPLNEIRLDDWQKEGILLIRDTKVSGMDEIVKKIGYKVLGIVEIVKFRKSYWRKNLWNTFTSEELMVAARGTECKLPEVLEFETEQELYKEISKFFNGKRPVEIIRNADQGVEYLLNLGNR